jgi:hypothetical protein
MLEDLKQQNYRNIKKRALINNKKQGNTKSEFVGAGVMAIDSGRGYHPIIS